MRKLFVLAFCAALAAACGDGKSPTGPTPKAPRISRTRFLAFGDSITAGENGRAGLNTFVDFPNLYPLKLEGMLNAEYPDQGIVVLNRGYGGDPIERGVERLPGVLEADHGDVLLLLDGYNNLLAECTPDRSTSSDSGHGPLSIARKTAAT